jgi:hypothetical protein
MTSMPLIHDVEEHVRVGAVRQIAHFIDLCGAPHKSTSSASCVSIAPAELLFNLITDRYERRATVVTTNLAFAEWVTVFAGDEKLTTALLDRLMHHATAITNKGKSYRMRKRRGRSEDA